jgi:hypothetical protein
MCCVQYRVGSRGTTLLFLTSTLDRCGGSHAPIALSSGKSVQTIAIAIPTEVPGALTSNTDVYSSTSGELTGIGSQLGDKLFESLSDPPFTYAVTVRVLVSPSQANVRMLR